MSDYKIISVRSRPIGVTALSLFFIAGAAISFTASVSLARPHSMLESIWSLNPRGHMGLVSIGLWAILLLFIVSVSCAVAAVGLWRGTRWGHRAAVTLIAINFVGDIINTLSGTEPRAIVGVPIALALLWYLVSKRVRLFFSSANKTG